MMMLHMGSGKHGFRMYREGKTNKVDVNTLTKVEKQTDSTTPAAESTEKAENEEKAESN